MFSTLFAMVALSVACLVAPSHGQAVGATINCYQCYGWTTGAFILNTDDGIGCGHPFNATGLAKVTCYGQCTKSITFNPSHTSNGKKDTIIRGCTMTTPPVGCNTDESGITTCVSVCSTDLCNSAVSLAQSAAVLMLAAIGLLAVNFRRQ